MVPSKKMKNGPKYKGRIQDFHLGGGGGATDYVRARTLWAQSPLRPGCRPHLRALEALRFFFMLSCYLSLIFKHSYTKWDKKNTHSQSRFMGGGGGGRHAPVASPLNPPLSIMITSQFNDEQRILYPIQVSELMYMYVLLELQLGHCK